MLSLEVTPTAAVLAWPVKSSPSLPRKHLPARLGLLPGCFCTDCPELLLVLGLQQAQDPAQKQKDAISPCGVVPGWSLSPCEVSNVSILEVNEMGCTVLAQDCTKGQAQGQASRLHPCCNPCSLLAAFYVACTAYHCVPVCSSHFVRR